MAQILVRDLDDGVVKRLKNRARREGRSLQCEVKMILERAAKVDMESALKLVDDFRRRFKGRKFSDSAELIREDRDR
jgi:plasmid stability protein